MKYLVQRALDRGLTEEHDGLESIEPVLSNIDANGGVKLGFVPPIVAVPNNWATLFSLEERESMPPADREVFEKDLIKIMNVQFEQNSEEIAQKFFYSELVDFTPDGIQINLNFSDPLLIS